MNESPPTYYMAFVGIRLTSSLDIGSIVSVYAIPGTCEVVYTCVTICGKLDKAYGAQGA